VSQPTHAHVSADTSAAAPLLPTVRVTRPGQPAPPPLEADEAAQLLDIRALGARVRVWR